MIQYYRDIIGVSIVGEGEGQVLGFIYDIIIHPDTGKIEAFWVKPTTTPLKDAIIITNSILKWGKKVYIKDESEISPAEDIIRISQILKRETFFIGNDTKNEEGELLGRVYDLDFDTQNFYLKNLYTYQYFLGIFKYHPRVFGYHAILEARPDCILVKDKEKKRIDGRLIASDTEKPLMETG